MRVSRWAAAGLAVLLVAGGATYVATHDDGDGCGTRVQAIRRPASPLLSAQLMARRPDAHRDRLADALAALPEPFGAVIAGVDYNYDQWLHLYGIQDAVLAWTKRNAPVTVLDPVTLQPRWGLRPATRRTAWDAGAGRFVLMQLSARHPTQMMSYDVRTGTQQWCAELGTANKDGDLLSTTVLEDGSVVAAARAGRAVSVARLSGHSGKHLWTRATSSVDRADFIGLLDSETLLLGGREEFRLADPSARAPSGPALAALSLADGRMRWTYSPPGGSSLHVLGVHGSTVIVVERGHDLRIMALDGSGRTVWSVAAPATAYESTLRGGVVLLETRQALVALAAGSGKRLWRTPVPTDRTFFPYGFTLAQMPSLDATHLLVPTTTDLRILDVRTGSMRSYPMPTDEISTTYWPYQLVVTDHVIGVLTNTGAVVVGREAG